MKLLLLPLAAFVIYSCGPSDQAIALQKQKDEEANRAMRDSMDWALSETVKQIEWEGKIWSSLNRRGVPKEKRQPYIDSLTKRILLRSDKDTFPGWYLLMLESRKRQKE